MILGLMNMSKEFGRDPNGQIFTESSAAKHIVFACRQLLVQGIVEDGRVATQMSPERTALPKFSRTATGKPQGHTSRSHASLGGYQAKAISEQGGYSSSANSHFACPLIGFLNIGDVTLIPHQITYPFSTHTLECQLVT